MKNVLIVGGGDIALRLFPLLKNPARSLPNTSKITQRTSSRIFVLVRNQTQAEKWRSVGATPLRGDLDDRASLRRLGAIANHADCVVHLAPPDQTPTNIPATDRRTRNLIATQMAQTGRTKRWVYISTTGVYGDHNGMLIDETARKNPQTPRAQRRADAETSLRRLGKHHSHRVSILRVPGIYAADRLPLKRIKDATPAIQSDEDGFTNHIHADDLARIIVATLRYGKANRIYHAVDDTTVKMGDYLDLVADAFDLPRVPRISRKDAKISLPGSFMSFMNESRRLTNHRLKHELKVKLRYPTVCDGLRAAKIDEEKHRCC